MSSKSPEEARRSSLENLGSERDVLHKEGIGGDQKTCQPGKKKVSIKTCPGIRPI